MNLLGKIPKNYIPIIEFGIKHLFSYQIIPYLIFEFKFKKSLNVLGNAAITEFNLKNKPREFLIQIKKNQEIEETIKTIFSSCVGFSSSISENMLSASPLEIL